MVGDVCLIYFFLILWFLDLLGIIQEILPSLPEDLSIWGMNDSVPQGIISLKQKLSTVSDSQVPRGYHVTSNLQAPYVYIFTSGTTGMIRSFFRLNAVFAKQQLGADFCHV